MKRSLSVTSKLLYIVLAVLTWLPVHAQPFPDRPIKFLVGYSAGGGTDLFARVLGKEISKNLGQPVIVENRPGANGMLAVQELTQSFADGHTIQLTRAQALQWSTSWRVGFP